MPTCDFNQMLQENNHAEVCHTSAWVFFCKFDASFSCAHLWSVASDQLLQIRFRIFHQSSHNINSSGLLLF